MSNTRTTVGDLIDKLEEYGRDVEVRIMHQKSYPLQEVIGGIWEQRTGDDCEECGDPLGSFVHDKRSAEYLHDFKGDITRDTPVLFLVANGHPRDEPYGDKAAWEEMELLFLGRSSEPD